MVSRALSRRVLYSKFRRAKDSSQYSEESLAEILGGRGRGKAVDPPPPSTVPTSSASSPPSLTSTSSLSIADYFTAKMRAKAGPAPSEAPAPSSLLLADAAQGRFDHLQAVSAIGRGGLGFHSAGSHSAEQRQRQRQPPRSQWGMEGEMKEERKEMIGGAGQTEMQPTHLHPPPSPSEAEDEGREEEEGREERRRAKRERRARREEEKRRREGAELVEEEGSLRSLSAVEASSVVVEASTARRRKKQRTEE